MCIPVTPRGPSQNKPVSLDSTQEPSPFPLQASSLKRAKMQEGDVEQDREGGKERKAQPSVTLQELVRGYGLFDPTS